MRAVVEPPADPQRSIRSDISHEYLIVSMFVVSGMRPSLSETGRLV
jgi:hypothetical protein